MKIAAMIRAELARLWATPMSRIALVALMLVPLLYGGLYLWANQDPYARLDQVPVALVVEDQGAGDTNYGDTIADQLLDDGSFDWHRVPATDASAGVDDGTYDFSVTIPDDFSAALGSASGDDPQQAELTLTTNDANSYLASTIGDQAIKTIRTTVVRTVNDEAATRLLVTLDTVKSSLGDAADGATQLVDGSAEAGDGASALADGTRTLADGTAQLPAQTARLADGAAQVADGTARIAELGERVSGASSDLTARLPEARSEITAVLDQTTLSAEQRQQLLGVLDRIDTDVRTTDATVQADVAQLRQLGDGARQVADGARALSDATPALAQGTADAADGASALRNGIGELTAGATTLRDGLVDGEASIPASTEESRALQAATIADPVHVGTSSVTSAGTYGAGLAPFFASLAAWIGIYALFLIVKPVSRRAITALRTPVRVTLAGWLTPGILGALQMGALFGILAGALHFDIHNPVATYGMMALASLTFAAIILALNVWLGSVGQFLGLILMVVQLVTAGGTFPWQTLPEPLAALHHVLPMSYAVDGVRQLMYGGLLDAAAHDALVLGAIALGAVAVAAIGVMRMTHSRTLRDLRPSLIG